MTPMTPQRARMFLPPDFVDQAASLIQQPLYTLVSTLITQFNLTDPQAKPFVETFQGLLHTFTQKGGGMQHFLAWWEEEGEDQRLTLTPDATCINVMTVHQAKGLAFDVVLLPFAHWSLDHPPHAAPILWVATEQAPFHDLGQAPVYYGKHLEATYYRHAYYKERMAIYLESLNLLYVATTRPRERLYLFAPYQEEPTTIGGLLSQTLNALAHGNELPWQTQTTASLTLWRLGEQVAPVERKTPTEGVKPTSLSNDAVRQVSLLAGVQVSHAATGQWWHTFLANITTQQEVAPLLQRYVAAQQLTVAEAEKIGGMIATWWADDRMRSWFSGDWQVKRECGILLTEGKMLQPDRVMMRGEEVVILDYKTGRPQEEHQRQVRTYAQTLKSMGYTNVTAYLFYITVNHLLPVVEPWDGSTMNG